MRSGRRAIPRTNNLHYPEDDGREDRSDLGAVLVIGKHRAVILAAAARTTLGADGFADASDVGAALMFDQKRV